MCTDDDADAKVTFPSEDQFDLLCVNVGKRVRITRSADETDRSLMREQSTGGAQWIPALLLQIVPGQVVKMPLMGNHTTQTIQHAVRLPAHNAGLIKKEGLDLIGVKSVDGVQPLVSLPFVLCHSYI
jgi:hypothetical protein